MIPMRGLRETRLPSATLLGSTDSNTRESVESRFARCQCAYISSRASGVARLHLQVKKAEEKRAKAVAKLESSKTQQEDLANEVGGKASRAGGLECAPGGDAESRGRDAARS